MRNIPVTKTSLPPYEEYVKEIEDLWDSHWLTNHGSKVARLEQEVCKYLETDLAISVVNGHQALELILRGLKLSGEIITTPFTFVSTTSAIVRCGCTPVFCDIDENDYTLDPDKIEELITDQTCAIMPVHVYGNVCHNDKIMEIAKKHNLKVIYDAAHAFGVWKDGYSVASMGDAVVYSFHATKAFHSIEGGMVVFRNEPLIFDLWEEENFGISAPDQVGRIAPNAKMNEFQAAMGLCNLNHISEFFAARKAVYTRYLDRLGEISGIILNRIPEDVRSNYAYFPIRVIPEICGFTRDTLFNHLNDFGIGTRKYFWPLTSSFDCYRAYSLKKTPVAEIVSEQILCLPMYSDLSIEDVDYICDRIIELIKQ